MPLSGYPQVLGVVAVVVSLGAHAAGAEDGWLHPAGWVSRDNFLEMREKVRTQPWAREELRRLQAEVRPWVEIPMARLRELTPTRRGNVYHNFTCPDDHTRLTFDPFENRTFRCPTCVKSFDAQQESNVYPPGDTYHGTFYDGWSCLYFISIAQQAWKMGLVYQIAGDEACAARAAEILLLYADIAPGMPREMVGGSKVIFTYNREGEVRILEFAGAYDLIRNSGVLSAEQRAHIERDFLKPFCDDVFMDPEMRADWNNVYWWQLAIAQVGVALEDMHYIDYAFGLGDYSAEKRPEHRSLTYAALHHFRPDGAHFGLNTGYQLYPLTALLQTIALGANLAEQEPGRFPAEQFDLRDPRNPVGDVARRAVYWYLSLSLPDYSMATVGDSMLSRDSMKAYDPIAELAYRYFGVGEVAYYPRMSEKRGLWGLLWGAPEIQRRPVPFESAHLSSGFTALRQEHEGQRLYVGLNHLQPGDGHQHADRLGIITYASDRLLGLEKGTPYNNAPVQNAARASYSHSTVTVDRASQPNGSKLKGDAVPKLAWLQSAPGVEIAEVRADGIYPQTSRYRRVVALVAGLVLDVFDVAGGETRDWLYHCAGQPAFSLDMQPREGFDTPAYVVGGTAHYERAATDATWSCTYALPALPDSPLPGQRVAVQHKVTMVGAPGTEVCHLGTYPVQAAGAGIGFSDNLTGTVLSGGRTSAPETPSPFAGLTHSLLARRSAGDSPFVAIYETFAARARLQAAELIPATPPEAVVLGYAADDCGGLLVYNPDAGRARFSGPMGDGRLDGHLALVRCSTRGRVESVSLLGARKLLLGGFSVTLRAPGNVLLTRGADGRFEAQAWADVAYETVGGERLVAPCDSVDALVTENGATDGVVACGQP